MDGGRRTPPPCGPQGRPCPALSPSFDSDRATRGWPQDLRSVKQDSQSCLSSQLEPFLSEKAGCPGGQGSFRRTRMRGVRARALVAQQRGGMLALIGPRRLARRCLPPSFDRNPQNVPDSEVRPSPAMAPEEVVAAQLEALRTPHEPRTNHGIQVMYEFCEGSGSMERSRYFGYSKDLYHFDHFLGGFQNEFKDLMEYDSYSFDGVGMNQEGEKTVRVTVRGSRGSQEYEKSFTFCLVTREFGTKKGCLMTSRIVKH
mmetsp:Transcript_10484/g.36211  ORF Transcript_10484/g.36211 Transcript_10484/m.36211 type:complete len:257 (+) Transcript_10484:1399-2169(+)